MERSTLAASKSQEPRLEAALDALYRVQFGWMDILRRIQGNAAAAIGFSPRECPYQIIASAPHWRLRDYGGQESAAVSLLVVAGPIKRPYIWDLTPSRSAICYCLQQDLHVYLLEWMPATQLTSNNGIDEITLAISNCVAKISARSGRSKPFLVGHSLGGTLAAIYGALASETIRGLILLGAPLCFEPKSSQFRDALVSLIPSNFPDGEPFPGSLLSHMSAMASPNTFIWSRLIDTALSAFNPSAMDIHARIERWVLDEVPLPGRLLHQLMDWLTAITDFFVVHWKWEGNRWVHWVWGSLHSLWSI
jgi:polyhydroxyalkanoate synthase subunit PhaC